MKLVKSKLPFTQVPNELIADSSLSLKAKGIFCLLMSKPEGWVFIEGALISESSDGRDAFRGGIRELEENGWLKKEQERSDGSRFSHNALYLATSKNIFPDAVDEDPDDVKPVVGDSDTNNKDISNTNKSDNPLPPKKEKKKSEKPTASFLADLERFAEIPTEATNRAARHGIAERTAANEWAKFRNYHLSKRSKHTSIDLCWDTWCRNVSERQGGGKHAGSVRTGQGGQGRHDPLASAKRSVLSEMFGVSPQDAGRAPADRGAEARVVGGGSGENGTGAENAGVHAAAFELLP